MSAGKHFVKDDAKSKDITRGRRRLSMTLLGGHVAQGSQAQASAGSLICQGVAGLMGEAKVEDFYQAIGTNHDVLWL